MPKSVMAVPSIGGCFATHPLVGDSPPCGLRYFVRRALPYADRVYK
jgi:hypothetical protein